MATLPMQGTSEDMDLAVAQAALQRRRQIAAELAKQSMSPMQGQMVSGHYVGPSKLQGFAQLMSAMAGQKMEKDLDVQEQELAGKRRAGLAKELDTYTNTRMGTPDQPMGPPTENDEYGLQPGQKANPRLAAIKAVASSMPELRQLGMLDLQNLGKQEQETYNNPVTERGPDGKLISVQYGNKGTRRPVPGAVPFEKPMSVADRVVDPADPTKPLADYSKTFGELRYIDRDLYQKDSTGKWNKLDNAPKTSVSVGGPTVHMGQKKIAESWAKAAVDTVNDLSTAARGGVKLIGTLTQLEALDKAGVQSGPLAPAGVWLAGLAQQMNIPVDKSRLANSQTFDAAAISAWQDMIAAAGGNRGVVKEEAARIAQMVPQLVQSAQGRQQITAFLKQAAQQSVADAQKAQKELADAFNADDPSKFTFGLSGAQLPRTDGLPAAPGSTAPANASNGVMSLDEYLRSRQGR